MRIIHFIPVIGLLCTPYAFANPGNDVPFTIDFNAPGGDIPIVDSDDDQEGISVFPLTMSNPSITQIFDIELRLNGLSHDEPDDLEVYLLDPFGETIAIMTDKGDHLAVQGINMIFNDHATLFPPDEGQLLPGPYKPEGLFEGGPGGFGNYFKQPGGPGTWSLLVIDDSAGDGGHLDSWTLHVTAVPEPVTLALLALGAMTVLRRRRA